MNYKNMKIEINESQPLDDVLMELKRLGYKSATSLRSCDDGNIVVAFTDGDFIFAMRWAKDIKLTTLTELKAMTND